MNISANRINALLVIGYFVGMAIVLLGSSTLSMLILVIGGSILLPSGLFGWWRLVMKPRRAVK